MGKCSHTKLQETEVVYAAFAALVLGKTIARIHPILVKYDGPWVRYTTRVARPCFFDNLAKVSTTSALLVQHCERIRERNC
jgi:hypothetical protein